MTRAHTQVSLCLKIDCWQDYSHPRYVTHTHTHTVRHAHTYTHMHMHVCTRVYSGTRGPGSSRLAPRRHITYNAMRCVRVCVCVCVCVQLAEFYEKFYESKGIKLIKNVRATRVLGEGGKVSSVDLLHCVLHMLGTRHTYAEGMGQGNVHLQCCMPLVYGTCVYSCAYVCLRVPPRWLGA